MSPSVLLPLLDGLSHRSHGACNQILISISTNNYNLPLFYPVAESIPIKPPEKKSYTQNCVAWIQQQGLQSDIQKILRHSRKLPEKTQQFYKVNKIILF